MIYRLSGGLLSGFCRVVLMTTAVHAKAPKDRLFTTNTELKMELTEQWTTIKKNVHTATVIELFKNKRSVFEALSAYQARIDKRSKKLAREYLDSFYRAIDAATRPGAYSIED